MRNKPLRPLISSLAFAGLVASGLAHADSAPVWQKNDQGKVADSLRIEVAGDDKACPTLVFRLGSASGKSVIASYVDPTFQKGYGRHCGLAADDPARRALPESLHELRYPGDVSFVEFNVLDAVPLRPALPRAQLAVKVQHAPELWLEKPLVSVIEPAELHLTNAIEIADVKQVCLVAPKPTRDCRHQPQVLKALKDYIKAVETFHEAALKRFDGLVHTSPNGGPYTDRLWFESGKMYVGATSPYAELDDVTGLLNLGSYAVEAKSEDGNSYKPVDLSTFEFRMAPELRAARLAWAKYETSLKGKKPLVRLRNAAGTETKATRMSGC